MRILVVEDYELLRDSVVQGLAEAGFAVDAAGDGETALWQINGGGYDVIVLDLMLPKVDGLEVLRRVRQRDRKVCVLILTAMHAACPAGYLPDTDNKWRTERNPALIDQAEDQIARIEDLLGKPEFQEPWLCFANHKCDVPKCARHVGHYCSCARECYVWVMPYKEETLRNFTLTVLDLASTAEQEIPRYNPGPVFSPALR